MPRKTARRAQTPLDFIRQHTVFRLDEFVAAVGSPSRSTQSIRRSLEHHLNERHLCSVRRGVYAHTTWVDPWLLASKLAKDAVVSHDGALSFHRLTGVGHRVCFMTAERTSVARYADVIYQPIRVSQGRLAGAGQRHAREGQEVRVTSVPDTLVDCLALLDRGPPLDQLMGIFKQVRGSADPKQMIRHARSFQSPLLMARLGFFLTCARFELEARDLQALNGALPKEATHFRRSVRERGDTLISRWNLIVPPELFEFWPGNG